MSSSAATKVATELAWAPAELSVELMSGWIRYWQKVSDRDADPIDVATDFVNWWLVATRRERPRWATRFRVLRTGPLARVLDYSTPRARDGMRDVVPTLILPPQAGHGSSIVDYSAEQSQVRTLREAGLERLYVLDWQPATVDTAQCSIEDYVAVIAETIAEVADGGPVNLVGDCQGGWLAVLYAGLHPEQVNTLTIGGAPVDTHAGDSTLRQWTKLLARGNELPFYRTLVTLGGGVQRGENQLAGFKLLEPVAEAGRLMDLLVNIDDPKYVRRHTEFTNWFEWTQDVPGRFYLWILRYLFVRNELYRGVLEVGGTRIEMKKVRCPIFLIAGTEDHITPPEQVWALADIVGTPKSKIKRELVDAGHLGLFMGRRSLNEHWAPLMREVASLS